MEQVQLDLLIWMVVGSDLAWGDYFQRSLYIIWNIGNQMFHKWIQKILYFSTQRMIIYTSGQNMPSFADIDSDGDMDLFITVLRATDLFS